MQTIRSWTLGAAILALSCTGALADKRVALVIGNSAYQHVARLANPANDAAAMAATFRDANFDIVEARVDLSAIEMRQTLRDFADEARDADVAVVYFAGHGIEVDGTDYLVPVDATLERDTDVDDETFALDRVLAAVRSAKRLRLVILDACRDNPLAKTMKRTSASRSIEPGLAKVEPSGSNTMIAFAAKAGSTALDGDRNSPFAAALVKYITRPGLDLRRAFGFVRDDVLKATGNRQEPFVYGSLGGDDVLLVPASETAAAQRDMLIAKSVPALDKAADGKAADGANGGANLASAERPIGGAVRSGSPVVADVPALLPSEPHRVRRSTGSIDGDRNTAAQKSREQLNNKAGARLDVRIASRDALDAVKSKPERRAAGQRCTGIGCHAGLEVGDNNGLEPINPGPRLGQSELRYVGSPRSGASEPQATTQTQSSAQIICLAAGCRPVRHGCRLEIRGYAASNEQSGQVEVCD